MINKSAVLIDYLSLLAKSSHRFNDRVYGIRKGNNAQILLVEQLMKDYFIPINRENKIEVFAYILTDNLHFGVEFYTVINGNVKINVEEPSLIIKIRKNINAKEWRDLWLNYNHAINSFNKTSSRGLFSSNYQKKERHPKKWENMDLYLELLRLRRNEKLSISKLYDDLPEIRNKIGHPKMPLYSKEEVKKMLEKIQKLVDTLS
ncbi:hypothetical protein COY05_02845 [Candidatus Peregrinibacteria bacterium CG_4_10_14_0_2_um_filter_38_24]|nr:MAG: hypothetical protein COY05_02845 [Candidatus Peregrinibacteria bacterium CG_4_10_14_0_2_um_filter_38_24]